jgi:hypothetical protein
MEETPLTRHIGGGLVLNRSGTHLRSTKGAVSLYTNRRRPKHVTGHILVLSIRGNGRQSLEITSLLPKPRTYHFPPRYLLGFGCYVDYLFFRNGFTIYCYCIIYFSLTLVSRSLQ